MHGIKGVLLVQLVHVRIVVTGGQVFSDLVGAADKVERIGGSATAQANTTSAYAVFAAETIGDRDIFVVIGVTIIHFTHVRGFKHQAVDFLRNQMPCLEYLRQQTTIAGGDGCVFELHLTNTQGAVGNFNFGRYGQIGVVVLRTLRRTV